MAKALIGIFGPSTSRPLHTKEACPLLTECRGPAKREQITIIAILLGVRNFSGFYILLITAIVVIV